MDNIDVAGLIGDGHLALEDEVHLLQGVIIIGPVSAAIGLKLGNADPELAGTGLILTVITLASNTKMTCGEIGLQLLISTLNHNKCSFLILHPLKVTISGTI